MKHNYKITIFLILNFGLHQIFYSCSNQNHKLIKENISNNRDTKSHFDIIEHSKIELSKRKYTNERIDSIFSELTSSPYTLCHFHNYYDKGHDYSKMHNSLLDELAFLNSYSKDYERYITRKTYTFHWKTKDELKWNNCLKFLQDNDCSQDQLLNQLGSILKDTTYTLEQSKSLLSHVDEVLNRKCNTVSNQIRTDTLWRMYFFKSLQNQISKYYKIDEVFDYYLYNIMLALPDRLTTQFAYNYILNNEDLPDGIGDIINDRFMVWDEIDGYLQYNGTGILLTENEVRNLIYRIDLLDINDNCEWCFELKSSLMQRFD